MKTRPAERDQIYRQVAHLHATCIDQGFLSTLGEPFLRLLYEAIDAGHESVLFLHWEGDRVVGFVAGTQGLSAVRRRLLKQWPRLAWALLPTLLSLRKLRMILEAVAHTRRAKPIAACPRAELLSIAVSPGLRGAGVSTRLYRSLSQHFALQGASEFCIVVGDSLISAHRFYMKMGAVPAGRVEVHAGQGSVVYLQSCSRG